MLRTTALVLAGLCFSVAKGGSLDKCSAERRCYREPFQKVYKEGLIWSVKSVPKDMLGLDLYVQPENVGGKNIPWLNKNLIYALGTETITA